ncbi:MAG TPA: cytochrome c peroxidase [Candidatus Polarisedimenticolia bacterium]|jgi:cytochrome c peroxidase|nr:cytochrome c peroxidase [Candidatus Polarisedimenticolia bacterium]
MKLGWKVGTLAALLAIGCSRTPKEPAKPPVPQGESFTSGEYTTTLPLGLQAAAAYVPENNPISEAKIDLGRKLYFDARLSKDGTVSCATCHDPDRGFSDARPTSLGIGRQAGSRNAPTVINRLFSQEQFWDGRAADLEAQALGPIQNPIEMGHTLPEMISNLKALAGYAPAFQAAFSTPDITEGRVAQAIATYERTVLAGNSPFDRYQAGEKSMLSESAVRGMTLFNDAQKANCVTCHAGFNFTDESYHNLGVGMEKPNPDWGRFGVTKKEFDKGAFKTPTLRNVTQSGPYMHDGSEATLLDVVRFYDRGGFKNQWLSKEIKPLNLTDQDRADLVAFLESLSGDVRGIEKPTLP